MLCLGGLKFCAGAPLTLNLDKDLSHTVLTASNDCDWQLDSDFKDYNV